jgi:hypothetical protein
MGSVEIRRDGDGCIFEHPADMTPDAAGTSTSVVMGLSQVIIVGVNGVD